MTSPLVSVLIPCWNAERTIGETLESVLAQTWPNIETIVVDDGSTDGSAKIVERLTSRGVKLFAQQKAGAAAARNAAYRGSTGDYIQFLDADDLLGPDKIERQVARLVDARDSVASAKWARFRRNPSDADFRPEAVWSDFSPLDWLALSRHDGLGMMFPAIWLAPRKVIEAAGPWDELLTLGDDSEYFTRVLLAAKRVLFCPGACCWYRSEDPRSLSARKSRQAWISAGRVLELSERNVLKREDSQRLRRGFALSWQHLAHACYPYAPDIAEGALARAACLHEVRIRPGGGPAFHFISQLLGWRLARRLQVAFRASSREARVG